MNLNHVLHCIADTHMMFSMGIILKIISFGLQSDLGGALVARKLPCVYR